MGYSEGKLDFHEIFCWILVGAVCHNYKWIFLVETSVIVLWNVILRNYLELFEERMRRALISFGVYGGQAVKVGRYE